MVKKIAGILIGVTMLAVFVMALISIVQIMGVTGEDAFKAMPDAAKSGISSSLYLFIGLAVSSLGIAIACILILLDKVQFTPYVLLGSGILSAIFIIVCFVVAKDYMTSLSDTVKAAEALGKTSIQYKMASMQYLTSMFQNLIFFATFACVPTFYGLKGLLLRKK